MKAQNLRIGNYVNEAIAGPIKITLSILMHIEGSENYRSIPLTEDILLKCGFGCDREFDNNFIDNVTLKKGVIRIDVISNYFTIELILGDVLEIPNIKYLHQLQNLYFALTGNELEFNY